MSESEFDKANWNVGDAVLFYDRGRKKTGAIDKIDTKNRGLYVTETLAENHLFIHYVTLGFIIEKQQ